MADAIKQLFRKVVSVASPETPLAPAPPASARPWAVCDEPVGNAWTINAHGREHRFFFITGCYKSGTHWVQNLLNLHPKVNVKGEFHFESVHKGFVQITETHWYLAARPRLRPVADASFQDFVRRMMYSETRDRPEALWLGDRTPRSLTEFLPGAPMINIIRDGRDVMVSWNFHHLRAVRYDNLLPQIRAGAERMGPEFREHPERYWHPGAGFLADEWWFKHHAKIWADIVARDLQQAPLLTERGVPILQLRYEAMHAQPDQARRDLFTLLGLTEDEAAAPSHQTRTLPGFDKESPTLFYRKGTTGEWKDFFTDEQKKWFKEVAGDTLIRAGYEKDVNW